MATTIFSGNWHGSFALAGGQEGYWNNYTDSVQIKRTSGNLIPTSNVTISKITIELYTKIWSTESYFMTISRTDLGKPGITGNDHIMINGNNRAYLNNGSSSSDIPSRPLFNFSKYGSLTTHTIAGNSTAGAVFQGQEQVWFMLVNRLNNTGNRQSGYVDSNNTVKITITWDYTYTPCTAPTSITVNNVAAATLGKSKTATLKWSGAASGDNNKITKYNIYRSVNGGEYGNTAFKTITTDATNGSCTIESSDVNGTKFTYKIKTIGTQAGYDSAISAISASLTTSFTSPAINSFSLNNRTEVVYVGATGASLTAICAASAGTNNPVINYNFYRNNNILIQSGAENSWTGTVKGGESYSVSVTGESGDTISFGKNITVSNLVMQKFTGEPSVATTYANRTIPVSLTTPTATVAEALATNGIKYTPFYINGNSISGEKNFLSPSLSSNKPASITIPSVIEYGADFIIGVQAICTARDGGTTTIDWYSGVCKIAGAPNPPIINAVWDEKASDFIKAGIQPIGYKTIHIGFLPATQNIQTGSGSTFTYQLVADTGSNKNIVDIPNGQKYITYDISSLVENSNIEFKIRAIDEYKTEIDSKGESIRKFVRPSITISPPTTSAIYDDNSITKRRLICKIAGDFNTILPAGAASDIAKYKIETICNSFISTREEAIRNGSISGSSYITYGGTETDQGLLIKFPCNADGIKDTFDEQLYNQVITLQNPRPSGRIKITVYYDNYEAYPFEFFTDFNYDFYKPLESVGAYSIKYNDGREYANPFENLKIALQYSVWTDATGDSSLGGTISTTITANNVTQKISNDSGDINYIYNSFASNDINEAHFIITRTLYFIGNNTLNSAPTLQGSLKIARWYKDQNDFYLGNPRFVTEDKQRYLQGAIVLPEMKCSSGTHINLNKIEYILINKDNDAELIRGTIIKSKEDPSEILSIKEIPFSFNTTLSNFNLFARVIYTNTAGNAITLDTSSIYMVDSAVTLALRKGMLGINTGIEYNPGDGEPTVLINGSEKTGTNSILQITSMYEANTQSSLDFLKLKAGDFESNFSTNGALLTVEKLSKSFSITLPVTQNENVTYNDSSYIITNSLITLDNTIEIIPAQHISPEQWKAYNKAQLIGIKQQDQQVTLKIMGKKPNIDIPVTLIIRGF